MRSWLDKRNDNRSRKNREARYLIGACRPDEYFDYGLEEGSSSLASRWMEIFGERTRYRTFEYRALEPAPNIERRAA